MEERGTRYSLEWIAPERLEDLDDVIRYFLIKQPESWLVYVDCIDDIMAQIYNGTVHVILLRDQDWYRAMMLMTIQLKFNKKLDATIEFITCNKFFRTLKFYEIVEKQLQEMGIQNIRGIAHPTIAKYMMKRHNYKSPGVVIRKSLVPSRTN